MDKKNQKRVILVTDGDTAAQKAVETAAKNIGGRCISLSAGNPTPFTGIEILDMIDEAVHDPVVVMVDDRGNKGMGPGERAMEKIIESDRVQVLGVVAVSSNGKDCNGLKVDCSITKNGEVIEGGVDKYGNSIGENNICGDTLSILKSLDAGIVVGIGDPGKMDGKDDSYAGAPITTMALKEILKRSGVQIEQ